MRLFIRVAELGNFSAVAKQLDVARSVVTRQIAALEKHLGIKLMSRSTRRLALTDAGTTYLERCRSILNLVDEAESDVDEDQRTLRGRIRIAVPLIYGTKRLAPLLLDFARQYPQVTLEMNYSDRRVNMIEEGFDLAIRIMSRPAFGDVARRIATERMLAVAAPGYLARYGIPRHPAELIAHQCLGYTVSENHMWSFRVCGKFTKFPVRSHLSCNNGEMLVEAAVRSLGITCQPEFVTAEYIADGRLQQILSDYPLPEFGVFEVLPGNRYLPHRVRVLMDWIALGIGRQTR